MRAQPTNLQSVTVQVEELLSINGLCAELRCVLIHVHTHQPMTHLLGRPIRDRTVLPVILLPSRRRLFIQHLIHTYKPGESNGPKQASFYLMHLLFGYCRIYEWMWDDFCAQKMEWMLSHTTSSMHVILSVMQNKHYCDQPHENTISTHMHASHKK